MMLETKRLNAGYGKLQILYDIDFKVEKGDFVVVVGPNGSGKSTLLKTLFGLTDVYSGTIVFDGRDITRLPPHERAKLGMAYLPQLENIFVNLTVEENLKIAGYSLDESTFKERLEEVFNIFPAIRGFLKRKAGTLSGGERQMLAMAMTLIRKPKLMMFDEPTAQLAPKVAMEVFRKIRMLRDELGITVILVEQNARKALEIGEKAYLLVSGRVVYEGDAKRLLEHPELGKLYLGIK